MAREKYGLLWDDSYHDIFIDLLLAKKWREKPYCQGQLLDPWEHLLRAARALFTKDQFCISRWTEEHAKDWTTENFAITWGSAACSKSNDYGAFAVLDWIVDPFDTITIMASTTRAMLQIRSFESMLRYFKLLKRNPYFTIPGKESKQHLAIINDTDDDSTAVTTLKASIKGVAVHEGTEEEARANLQGAHLPYVRLILDELSQMKPAAMSARVNLSMGTKDFRLFGLCNPDSIYDLAGQYSVPIDGWNSVDENTDYWKTQWGCVRHHNGFKSPAILEENGAEKYPFLINQAAIDKALKENNNNEDHPQIWTMIKGFPPPQMSERTVLTESMIKTFNMSGPVIWRNVLFQVAALDPAFTADGDDAVLQTGIIGYDDKGRLVLCYGPAHILKILASSDRPVIYQVVDQVAELRLKYGFEWSHLAVDDSGTQSVADVIDATYNCRCCRINSQTKASELPVSAMNNQLACKAYRNRITECYYSVLEFGQYYQIKGLPSEAARQFCLRRIKDTKYPRTLETKLDFKKRLKRSPDQADACALITGLIRERLNFIPGASMMNPSGVVATATTMTDPEWIKRVNNFSSEEYAQEAHQELY